MAEYAEEVSQSALFNNSACNSTSASALSLYLTPSPPLSFSLLFSARLVSARHTHLSYASAFVPVRARRKKRVTCTHRARYAGCRASEFFKTVSSTHAESLRRQSRLPRRLGPPRYTLSEMRQAPDTQESCAQTKSERAYRG